MKVILLLTLLGGASKDDIKKLVSNGISDTVVLAYIKANTPAPKLSSDDILELKKAGASDTVLEALLASSAKPKKTVTPPATRPTVVYRSYHVPTYTYRRYYYPGYTYCPSYRFRYSRTSGSGRFGFRVGW